MFIKLKFHNSRLGVSLVELLMAIAIGGIILAAVASITMYSARSFVALQNYADLDDKSRNALDIMTRDIRQVTSLTTFATNRLDFLDADRTSTLSYVYDVNGRTLTRISAGVRSVLLTECDTLAFGMFQRNPIGGTFDQFTNTLSAATCKLVQVNWVCSRSIMQGKVNTESVQTSKIVIRNQ